MAKLIRPDALYKQLANEIRDAIARGEYPPGSPLPSENALTERYGISKPTVRLALAALRGEGLIKVINGKGSYVRESVHAAPHTITRHAQDPWHGLEFTGPPQHYRQDADARTAALLRIPEAEPTFVQDQTATDPATGRPVLTRRTLPFAITEGTSLETDPYPERAHLLKILADAHGNLTTTPYTRAYPPTPDEAATLHITDNAPILETTWITTGADGQPLIAETEHANAEGIQYNHTRD